MKLATVLAELSLEESRDAAGKASTGNSSASAIVASSSSSAALPLTVDDLRACVEGVVGAGSATAMDRCMAPILAVLRSPRELGRSFRLGGSTDGNRDFAGVHAVFAQLFSKDSNPWSSHAAEAVRNVISTSLGENVPAHRDQDVMAFIEDTEEEDGAKPPGAVTKAVNSKPDTHAANATDGTQPLFEWASVLLAAVLPLLANALPRDANGISVIPHRHEMERLEASEDSLHFTPLGRTAYRTHKVCDNCQVRITDRFFFHCSENCDTDFCSECHKKLQEIFDSYFADEHQALDKSRRYDRIFWVISTTDRIAAQLLRMSHADRMAFAHELAFEWPQAMFEQFVSAVTDVVNAKVVHVQDVKDVQSDADFWSTMGLLQFLYGINSLPCSTLRIDEENTRGPKIEYDNFILEGINKCEPISEWQRWKKNPSARVPDVLAADFDFVLTADFCSFLTHSNLVPIGFRRVCLLCDVWEQVHIHMVRMLPLQLEVQRAPAKMLADILACFRGLNDVELRRPLRVTFEGELAAGQGVTREFFKVALRSFLEGGGLSLFHYNEHQRTYWFSESADNPEAYRACGILLGQAILNNVLVPNIFPRVLYDRLLEDLGSPCAKSLGIEDVAAVSQEIGQSLQKVLDHEGADIGDVFGDLDWAATGRIPEGSQLTQETKAQYVQGYVQWFFHERIAPQLDPFSEGFRAILGGSSLLQRLVDAVQLEKILCGGSVPVDIVAIQRGAATEGWSGETEYISIFWDTLASFTEQEKVQFVVFCTASDRVPLRGWQDLRLNIQKHGVGDDRLPTAHTCFCQLLLPHYSSKRVLRTNLLLAIANSEGFGMK